MPRDNFLKMQMYFGRFILPTLPLTLPTVILGPAAEELKENDSLTIIEELGLGSYVDYDAMVYRRSGRTRKQRDLKGCGVYTG